MGYRPQTNRSTAKWIANDQERVIFGSMESSYVEVYFHQGKLTVRTIPGLDTVIRPLAANVFEISQQKD